MKKVIVFGATGSVGAYTCLYLNDKGYQVVAVGHRHSDNGCFGDNGIEYHSVDVTDMLSITQQLMGGGENVCDSQSFRNASCKNERIHSTEVYRC